MAINTERPFTFHTNQKCYIRSTQRDSKHPLRLHITSQVQFRIAHMSKW